MALERDSSEWIAAVQAERTAAVARFNDRRNIEWRVSVTLWGGFGLVANALQDESFDAPAKWVMSGLAVLGVALHVVWVQYFVIPAAKPNQVEGRRLTERLRIALGIPETLADDQSRFSLLGYWWQVGVTAVIAGFVIVIVWT